MTNPQTIAVLDANVLAPPGVRDLLLSLADLGVIRPVWQDQIEVEVARTIVKLRLRHGSSRSDAQRYAANTVKVMNRAFPDARLDRTLWEPLVAGLVNDPKTAMCSPLPSVARRRIS